jgi:antitoxin SocA-like protein
MTTFVFDIDKTVAAAAYIAQKSGGRVSIFVLLKMLYAGERQALIKWHRPITGDSFYNMKRGIVLSRTYNLIKQEVLNTNSDMVKWSQYFSPRDGNYVSLVGKPDFDFLSEREREALDNGFDEITELIKKHGRIAEVLHELWPEWKDPGDGSIQLDPMDVLCQIIDNDDEVQRIRLEIQAVQDAKAALQTA